MLGTALGRVEDVVPAAPFVSLRQTKLLDLNLFSGKHKILISGPVF